MFDNYLFRCSQLGKIMTNDRSGKSIGQTALTYLNSCYIGEVYKRRSEIKSKFLEKGVLVEQTSVSLLSEVDKQLYFTYKGRPKENDFIKGTPDIITPKGIDIKSSWDIFTFFDCELTKDNYWQALAYAWLFEKESWEIAYCLVSAPEHLIVAEERRLYFQMGVESEENPEYQIAKSELRRNMVFEDIEKVKRVKRFLVEMDLSKIEELKARIILCREILNQMYADGK